MTSKYTLHVDCPYCDRSFASEGGRDYHVELAHKEDA